MKKLAQDMGPGWYVLDLDAGKTLQDVEWVDEATGEYQQAVRDADGKFQSVQDVEGRKFLKSEVKRGNIRLILVGRNVKA